MELKRSQNFQNQIMLTGTKYGKRPMYLDIIDYVNTQDRVYFTKKELMSHSSYSSYGNELFAQFNNNKILVYSPSHRAWERGRNYYEWINEYYPEATGPNVQFTSYENASKLSPSYTTLVYMNTPSGIKKAIKELLENI